ANTSNRRQTFQVAFRSGHKRAEEWDPFTGNASGIASSNKVDFDLQPYESRILVLSDEGLTPAARPTQVATRDISHDWSVRFEGESQGARWKDLTSWTDDPERRYYSGIATYTRTVEIARAEIGS